MTAESAVVAPVCAATALRYGDYLRLDALLASQQPRSGQVPPLIHDEHFFIVLHQAQELWFKQILCEMQAVLVLDPASPRYFREALPLVRRIAAIEVALVEQLRLLRTLDPAQFMAMRPLLGSASGAQSIQFRLIEATMGVLAASPSRRDVEMLPAEERTRVWRALSAPSLHDRVAAALRCEAQRRGSAGAGHGPAAGAWQALDAEVLGLVRQVRDAGDAADTAIREVLEALCAFEESMIAWRDTHAAVVRDLLDELPGTGGTAGHAYLRSRLLAQPRSALSIAMGSVAEAVA
jgi:tryptophan 2,3-dioxygenase